MFHHSAHQLANKLVMIISMITVINIAICSIISSNLSV